MYPILAYIFFIATISKYSKGLSTKWNKIGLVVLIATLLSVGGLLVYGFSENKITFDSKSLTFNGSYGESLTKSEIQSVELVSQLPEITLKANGFALGTTRKGYFKTNNGEIVKLILNSENRPIILFAKTDGQKIFYSAKDKSNKEVLDEMKKTLPNIVYKQ